MSGSPAIVTAEVQESHSTRAATVVGGVATNAAVLAVARRLDATPAQVRPAWTLSRGPHVLA